jgi:hypothetical protein
MKQFSIFAALAFASGGLVPSLDRLFSTFASGWSVAPYQIYAAETGGAVSGFRVSAITSGRKGSSRGTAVFAPCFG